MRLRRLITLAILALFTLLPPSALATTMLADQVLYDGEPGSVPTTADLYDVHFRPQVEGWMAGSEGTILHWEPSAAAWELVATPITATLRGVFAQDANTAWAVGDAGVFLSWDGNTWTDISGAMGRTLLAQIVRKTCQNKD